MDKENKREYSSEDKTKFNMDLAYQEMLFKMINRLSNAKVIKDYEYVFNILKEISISLGGIMTNSEEEKIKKLYDDTKKSLSDFNSISNKHNIFFDYETSKYTFDKTKAGGNLASTSPKEFNQAINKLGDDIDNMDIALRRIMIRLGLYLLKSKTGLDAASA